MNIYITGDEVAQALDKAGIVTTPETASAYRFGDAGQELGRIVNLQILRYLEKQLIEVRLRGLK